MCDMSLKTVVFLWNVICFLINAPVKLKLQCQSSVSYNLFMGIRSLVLVASAS
jgi:hypothetical protein